MNNSVFRILPILLIGSLLIQQWYFCMDNCLAYHISANPGTMFSSCNTRFIWLPMKSDCRQCYFEVDSYNKGLTTFDLGIYSSENFTWTYYLKGNLNAATGFTSCDPGYCAVRFGEGYTSLSIQMIPVPQRNGCVFNNSHCTSTVDIGPNCENLYPNIWKEGQCSLPVWWKLRIKCFLLFFFGLFTVSFTAHISPTVFHLLFFISLQLISCFPHFLFLPSISSAHCHCCHWAWSHSIVFLGSRKAPLFLFFFGCVWMTKKGATTKGVRHRSDLTWKHKFSEATLEMVWSIVFSCWDCQRLFQWPLLHPFFVIARPVINGGVRMMLDSVPVIFMDIIGD